MTFASDDKGSPTMYFEHFVVGPLQNNVFLVVDKEARKAAIIDPGFEHETFLTRAKQIGANIGLVINTHGHFDHTGKDREIRDETGAKVVIHEADAHMLEENAKEPPWFAIEPPLPCAADLLLKGGETLEVGRIRLKVLHTPGHTEGSICLYEPIGMHLFSGDTLFAGTFGRTDLPGGDASKMVQSLRQLSRLPPQVRVYPGHGPFTTIGKESWAASVRL